MRTACFVDGYNVYYGLLTGTSYKWLDLKGLIQHILHIQNPTNELLHVSYFTSMVKPDLARLGDQSLRAQQTYIRALEAKGVNVVLGRHRLDDALAPVYEPGKKASRDNQCRIWQLEEKETDVNIAISMYRMAAQQHNRASEERVQQIVLMSADTDMAPALTAIKQDFPELVIGVIIPHREGIKRNPPGSLINSSHWIRRQINNDELLKCQFPDRVPTRKKPADKPPYW